MKKAFSLCIALLFVVFCACGSPKGLGGSAQRPAAESSLGQFRPAASGDYIATISTSAGQIKALLFAQHAPQAVENLRLLAGQGYYNGTLFHRVKKNFIIQGGDATGTGTGGESAWGKPFPIEYSSQLYHFSGALCMVSATPPPGQISSQFYIVATPWDNCQSDNALQGMLDAAYPTAAAQAYRQVGGAPYLDRQDTVFGQVINGMDIVDKIANTATGSGGRPQQNIVVEKITVEIME